MANLRADNLCGTGFVSANDGTVWSDYVTSTTGSTLTNYPATYGFDGNLSNFVYADNNSTITWTPPNGGIKAGLIEVYVYAGNTHPLVRVNGKNTGAVVGSSTPDQRGNWVDVTDLVDGHLKTIEADGYTISSTARSSGWAAVRINGEILVDGEQGRTGGRNAIDGSLYFGGDNDKAGLTIADTTDLELGSETNWTIEFWVKLNHGALSDWDVIMGKGSSQGSGEYEWFVEVMAANHLIFLSTTAGVAWDFNQQITPVLEIGEWYHVAIVRNGSGTNTLKSYVNGQQYSTHTSQNIYTGNDTFGIGHFAHTNGLNSDVTLSNVRIVKGTSVYTAEFTPPTEKLKPITNTVLLCCQDSDDPTQEATGKTITAVGSLDYSLRDYNLITNGNFDSSATTGWTVASGSAALGTGQSGTFGDGNHLVLTSGTMTQAFTTVVGRTYLVNCQSNGADNSFISTSASSGDAIITDIRNTNGNNKAGNRRFIATQTTYYVILTGGGGGGNFDTVSVYEQETPKAPKVFPPVGVDAGVNFYGDTKVNSQNYMYFPTGDTSQRGRGRGAFAMTAAYPNTNNSISYIDIASQGIAKDFGDLTAAGRYGCGNSSATRGVSGGAIGRLTTMDYFTLASTGNAQSFGTLTYKNYSQASVANSTRIIWISGNNPDSSPESNINVMTYITTATKGNGTDFGDYTDGEKARYLGGNISSSTRGLAFGGYHDPNYTSNIDYVTIGTTGASQDFGDMSAVKSGCPGCSDTTRGVIFGGYNGAPASVNNIDMVTIATTGSTKDFGDLSATTEYGAACSNSIRGVHLAGGYPGTDNSMAYVTIQSTGNARDFGDLPTGETGGDSSENNNFSDSHGGVS